MKLGWRLSHLADNVLIARVDDTLTSHCLPLERSELLACGQVDRLAFLLNVVYTRACCGCIIWIIIVAAFD